MALLFSEHSLCGPILTLLLARLRCLFLVHHLFSLPDCKLQMGRGGDRHSFIQQMFTEYLSAQYRADTGDKAVCGNRECWLSRSWCLVGPDLGKDHTYTGGRQS